jgi:DNA-binding IclR family transcriptional regulator
MQQPEDTRAGGETTSRWTFLTNHGHVLLTIAADPGIRARDIALRVGITERAAQRIVAELEAAGYLSRWREGRRNHYEVHRDVQLRHPVEQHHDVGQLLRLLSPNTAGKTAPDA